MKLRFINRPVAAQRESYQEALHDVTTTLSADEGILSVYRFGNITTPGISDIDVLAVFKNGAYCNLTGFEGLKPEYAALFTHGIMALCEDHFYKNHHYTIWSDYIYVSGSDIAATLNDNKNEPELQALKKQTALEFIIANYIDIKMQLTYGTFKLRSLLQHMKGLIYDFDYLGITSGRVRDMLLQIREWNLNWFSSSPPSDEVIARWLIEFDMQYELFCRELFASSSCYLPAATDYKMARNATLIPSPFSQFKHRGFVLPAFLSLIGRKYINLQNRFNAFQFYFPVVNSATPIVEERFLFLKEMKAYNKQHLPAFMTITTSITSKII